MSSRAPRRATRTPRASTATPARCGPRARRPWRPRGPRTALPLASTDHVDALQKKRGHHTARAALVPDPVVDDHGSSWRVRVDRVAVAVEGQRNDQDVEFAGLTARAEATAVE